MSKCAFDKTRNCTDDCEWYAPTDDPEDSTCLYLRLLIHETAAIFEIEDTLEDLEGRVNKIEKRL